MKRLPLEYSLRTDEWPLITEIALANHAYAAAQTPANLTRLETALAVGATAYDHFVGLTNGAIANAGGLGAAIDGIPPYPPYAATVVVDLGDYNFETDISKKSALKVGQVLALGYTIPANVPHADPVRATQGMRASVAETPSGSKNLLMKMSKVPGDLVGAQSSAGSASSNFVLDADNKVGDKRFVNVGLAEGMTDTNIDIQIYAT